MANATTEALTPLEEAQQSVALRVKEGIDEGLSVTVTEPILVGSSSVCALQLSDPTVSRRHLEVGPSRVGLRIEDASSRNGSWLGKVRVQSVELPIGETLRIGSSLLEVVKAEPAQASDKPETIASFGAFRGRAASLAPVYRVAKAAAGSTATVLIEGESGTGKTLIAEAIHMASARSDAPFVVVDCASLPENLIESELFGHERGAFTGAVDQRIGAFEEADGGTVFLDEIGELPLSMQTRLLRVLENSEVRRVGGNESIDLNIRIIAATNRNLDHEVEAGRFRVDLFHRLAVLLIRVPPLRQRLADLRDLAEHFLRGLGVEDAKLSDEELARIEGHPWHGNVRELRNYIRRRAVFGAETAFDPLGEVREEVHIPGGRSGAPYRQAREVAIEAFSRVYVEDMLRRHGGNVTRAAEAAGVTRRTFQRLKAGSNDTQGEDD